MKRSEGLVLAFQFMTPIVQIENLGYAYPPVIPDREPPWILQGIDLEIEEGEFLSIMGPTGAGKTTLGLALNGIVPQSTGGKIRGEVRVDGLNTKRHTVAELAQRVGVVFQEPETQLFNLTVEAEVAFGLESMGLPRNDIGDRLDWALRLVGMEEFKRRSPFQLSGGQKQRVAIASILAMKPRIMVLDEPTASLDPAGKSEVFAIVRRLRMHGGMTIVMIEHESEQIAAFSDRVAILDQGTLVAEGSPREIFTQVKRIKELGLAVPQVSELGHCLAQQRFPAKTFIHIDEAYQALTVRIQNSGAIDHPDLHASSGEKGGPAFGLQDSDREARGSSAPQSPSKMAASGLTCLELVDLSFAYENGPTVLHNVNLSVRQGELLAVIGQNGSGKTTLGKHLNGLLRPATGQVLLRNEDIRDMSVSALSRSVGYVFQNPDHQIFSATTREEIAFGPRNLGLEEAEVAERTKEALERFDLGAYAEYPPATLSYGLRRQITIAAVYAMCTPVWILDEPTTGLDFRKKVAVMEMLRDLNREGVTIILITHDMRLVAEFVPQCVVLQDGRVLLQAETRQVVQQADLLEQTGVELPQITRLAQRMHAQGMRQDVLSVQEFCEQYMRILQGSDENEVSDAGRR